MHRTFFLPTACIILALAAPSALRAGVEFNITLGPPPIPSYEQPVCPQDGYAWTPGYWAYGDAGYFWVPGTWTLVPSAGLLWTPGYWGWGGQNYLFHEGYWGPQVGFYGGVNYGYGYSGSGFQGGYWQGQTYYYNRAVTHLDDARATHVYSRPVAANSSHVAFNGGSGGLRAAPSAQDRKAEHDTHLPPTSEQAQHHQGAMQNKAQQASVNHGRPPVAATAKPGDFTSGNHTAARPAPRAAPASRPQAENRPQPVRNPHPAPRPEPAQPPRNIQPAPRPQPVRPPRIQAPQPRPEAPRPNPAKGRPEPPREENHR